jgi:hypothetical protein
MLRAASAVPVRRRFKVMLPVGGGVMERRTLHGPLPSGSWHLIRSVACPAPAGWAAHDLILVEPSQAPPPLWPSPQYVELALAPTLPRQEEDKDAP